MAIIFAEGFDHYGTFQRNSTAGLSYGSELSESQCRFNMLSGVWAEAPLSAKVRYIGDVDGGVGTYPFEPRTGKGALCFSTGTGSVHFRRSLNGFKGADGEFVGIAFAVWVAQLPSEADSQQLVSFLDSRTFPNVAFLLQPDGSISVNVPFKWPSITSSNWGDTPSDSGTISSGSYQIATTNPGAFVAGTWNHVEVKVAIGVAGDPDPGQVYLKLNEVELITEADVTTIGSYSSGTYSWADNDSYVTQVSFLFNSGSSTNQLPLGLDDIVCWDSTGTIGEVVTDWVGDKNVVLQPLAFDVNDGPAFSGLADDWGIVGGDTTPKDAIDDFQDPTIWTGTDTLTGGYETDYDDTVLYPAPGYQPYYNGRDTDKYLVAEAAGNKVEFQTDIPSSITNIIAAILVNSLRKTQASSTKVQASIVDGGTPVLGADRPVAQDFTYYHDILERDAAGDPWTYATLNAAKVRIERTT